MDYVFSIPQEQEEFIGQLIEAMADFSPETYAHLLNTAEIALTLCEYLNLDTQSAQTLYLAALVHDVGKGAIDPKILHNPHITAEEFAQIKKHPIYTKMLLKDNLPKEIVDICHHHHEMPNGKGYPQGLVESELSELDKMLSVCDVTSALILPRSYKKPFTREEVKSILIDKGLKGELDKNYVAAVIDCYVATNEFVKDEEGYTSHSDQGMSL